MGMDQHVPMTTSSADSSSRWYYADASQQPVGPIAASTLQVLYANGVISSETLIIPEGGADWQAYRAVFPVTQQPTPPPPAPVIRNNKLDELQSIDLNSLGRYVRSTLQSNERPIYKTAFSWVIFVRPVIMFLLSLLIAWTVCLCLHEASEDIAVPPNLIRFLILLPSVVFLIKRIIQFVTSEFVVTDSRIIIKIGLIWRKTLELFVSKVESVSVDQGIAGRLLNFGTIVVRGTGRTEEPYAMIARPVEFRNWVQRVQH